MPNRQWERIKLSENYTKALAQLDERLIYWPSWLIHKCKQRLTRLTQVAIRTRRMALLDAKMGEKLVGIKPKIKRREETRERKALAAAKLERSIEKELIERLKSGAYGEQPLNVEEGIWKKVLKGLEREGQAERDVDYESEEEEEEEDEEEAEVEYVSGDEDLEDEELADLEDWLGEGEESGASSFEEDSNDEDVSDSDESDSGDEADEDDDEKSKKKPSGPKRPLDTGKKRKSDAPAPKAKKRRECAFVDIVESVLMLLQVAPGSRSSTRTMFRYRGSWQCNVEVQLRDGMDRCAAAVKYKGIGVLAFQIACRSTVKMNCCLSHASPSSHRTNLV